MRTLQKAKEWLNKRLKEGAKCPCCGQYAKLYFRKITSSMAYGLFILYQYNLKNPGRFVHVERYFKKLDIPPSIRGDFSKLVHWGLIEKQYLERDDGSVKRGYYRITGKGILFIFSEITVPEFVKIYNGKLYGFSGGGLTFKEALGNKFNYGDLFKGSVKVDLHDS